MLSWAIAGLGGAGLGHARRVTQVEGLELVGGCDPSAEAQERFAAETGCPTYADLATLLAEARPQGVTIASPSALHGELAIQALEAGADVLVEKPFAPDIETAQEMVAVAQAAGRVLAPFHNRRFDPDFLVVSEVLESGRLGVVRHIHSTVGGPGGNQGWRAVRALGGGRLYDWGPHLLDQVLALNPAPVIDVWGVLHVLESGTGDADEYFRGELRFVDGPDVTVEMVGYAFLRPTRWVVYGEQGTLEVRGNIHGEFSLTVCQKDGQPHTVTTTRKAEEQRRGDGALLIYAGLRDHILRGEPLPVSAEHALRVTQVIDAIRRSAEVEKGSVKP